MTQNVSSWLWCHQALDCRFGLDNIIRYYIFYLWCKVHTPLRFKFKPQNKILRMMNWLFDHCNALNWTFICGVILICRISKLGLWGAHLTVWCPATHWRSGQGGRAWPALTAEQSMMVMQQHASLALRPSSDLGTAFMQNIVMQCCRPVSVLVSLGQQMS